MLSRVISVVLVAAVSATIWPQPYNFTNGSTVLAVTPDPNFITANGAVPQLLIDAFARYSPLLFPVTAGSLSARAGALTGLTVAVKSQDDSHPQLGIDESYSLDVPVTGGVATLTAPTMFGALRGLETFSQLVTFDYDSASYVIRDAPWAIADQPRFPQRGLMIDTSRHFQPLPMIRAIIDTLPYAKLNVLHWHMSDSQSFPLEVQSRPHLWKGAWSAQERYLKADVAEIVEYARARGVRVMVEFDVPGHAASWCVGYPEVCPSSTCTQPLNVANNATFELITDLLNEVSGSTVSKPGSPSDGLFKDNFVHLGGDEVNTHCWTATPEIAEWLTTMNMTADDGYAYFVKRAAEIVIAHGHRPVQWCEVYNHFKNSLAKETIVHVWLGSTNITEVVAGGYNVLFSLGTWYLDHLSVRWSSVYELEPCAGIPDDLCPLILGGHGEMWGETADASDVMQTIWPRLAAIAERLWSPRSVASADDALPRIQDFRCLLLRRGVAAAPLGGDARSAPPGPGSCSQ